MLLTFRIACCFSFLIMLASQTVYGVDLRTASSSMESGLNLFQFFNGSTWDNYHKYETHDMNADGVIDRVECKGNSDGYFVRIRDGQTGTITNLAKPGMSFNYSHGRGQVKVTGCSIVEVKKGHPSVVVSSFRQVDGGPRWGHDQHMLYNKGSGSMSRRFARIRITIGSRSIHTVGRDVRCTRYPKSLESRFGEGALCFFSGYHGDSVLAKIEPNGNSVRTLDITPDSGLIWNKGNASDSGAWYDYYNRDSCQGSHWGSYYTIGGAWLDFNNDGLPDLVTTGQHAPTWANRMRIDHNSVATEGIKFSRQMIHNNSNTHVPTEFIRATALNEIEPELPSSCVYLSMEWQGCGDVRDHLVCYESNRWVRKELPHKFVSLYRKPVVKGNGKGQVLLKTLQKDETPRTYYYNYTGKLIGEVTKWGQNSKKVFIHGYACRQNTQKSIQIRVKNAGKLVYAQNTAVALTDTQKVKCMQPGTKALGFSFSIPKSKLSSTNKKLDVRIRELDSNTYKYIKGITYKK